jgi:ligand-binding SRPBCC domain-containing protein
LEEVIALGKAISSIEIEASPERVFAFVTDNEKMKDLTKDWVVGELTSDGPVGVGSTMHYVGVNKMHTKGGEWNAVVTEFTKNKSFTMSLKGANKRSNDQTNYYAFEPTSKGTKMTITMDYKMGKLADVLVAHRTIEKENMKMLEKLKKILET